MAFSVEDAEEEKAGDMSKSYYVVGTTFTFDDEIEPTRGRILVFEVVKMEGEERRLVLVTEKMTRGAVFDLCAFGGKLLAGINAKIQLYRWNDKTVSTSSQATNVATMTTTTTPINTNTPRQPTGANAGSVDLLSQECGCHGHTLSLFIRAVGNNIVVGDLIKSISLLKWEPETNSIVEKCRDLNSTWVSALAVLDDTTFLIADTYANMIIIRPNSSEKGDENVALNVNADFHWGDFVNVFCKGSLVMRQKQDEEEANVDGVFVRAVPKLLFGTTGGAIGVLATLDAKEYALLDRLQSAMNTVVSGIGGQKYLDWRAFRNNTKTHSSRGFVDGDLVEMLLEMNLGEVEKVAELMNQGLSDKSGSVVTDEPARVTPSSLTSLVEELTRLH